MAGELESLHGNEPLAARIERHDYDRMVMLSDGVFAIAITLLALELPVPEAWDGSLRTIGSVAKAALVGYLFAFLMVGAFWLMHRRIFAQLLRIDRVATVITLAILGFVGLAPYVARLVAEVGPTKGLAAYVLLVAVVMLLQVMLWGYAMTRSGMIHAGVTSAERTNLLLRFGSIAVIWGALGLWAALRNEPVAGELLGAAAVVSIAIRRLGAGVGARRGPDDAPTSLD